MIRIARRIDCFSYTTCIVPTRQEGITWRALRPAHMNDEGSL
jgi:hypothetical protein